MSNRWNISEWLEQEIRDRDVACVYCGVAFTTPPVNRKSAASWEHIINDARIITRENIALCCVGCNASKGQRRLADWLQSQYCTDRGITSATVAPVVTQALSAQISNKQGGGLTDGTSDDDSGPASRDRASH